MGQASHLGAEIPRRHWAEGGEEACVCFKGLTESEDPVLAVMWSKSFFFSQVFILEETES